MRTEGADSNLVVRRVTVFRAGANDEWALMNAKVVEAGLTEEQRAQEVKSQPFLPLRSSSLSSTSCLMLSTGSEEAQRQLP